MKINEFTEKSNAKKELMKMELASNKLERVQSLWYFVKSTGGGTIAGSKG